MDFEAMFLELAKQPEFQQKVSERFKQYATKKQIPMEFQRNHTVTWDEGAQAGAAALAAIIGETMAKHPYLAKQAAKMMGVENAG